MDSERWKLVDGLLQSALECEPARREAFLQEACGGDQALLEEVKSLLTSYRRADGFLETPAAEMAARALADEETQLPGSLTGQIVSHYRILKLIGRGGMGTVWLAERCDGRFERKVAIKFIYLSLLDQAGVERFKREGAILGKLAHPQIAELIDAGLSPNGEPFLVLEYVEGEAIDEYCDKNTLNVEARIRLFLGVLKAVAHAHSNLIVHRDIKPSNVLVRIDGQVKLLDFGIAKVLADETAVSSASMLTLESGAALTPRFATPEQVTGGIITTATDIYSLGVLLYLLLTGQHPAGPGPHSPAQLLKMIVEQEPARASDAAASSAETAASRATTPDKLRRQLQGDLDRILGKAIKKNPAERYPSVQAFADDLQRYLEHKPVLARPDSLGYRAAKFVRRNRVPVAAAAVALSAIVAGLAGILIQDRKARTERDFAFHQLSRVQQHDEFLDFVLSDAAPSGKPFSVNDLLARAERIVEREKPSPMQLEMMEWIGLDYASQDQPGQARPIVERAYRLSQQSSDPVIRAAGSCALGYALSRDEDLDKADALIRAGLNGLSDDPQDTLARLSCLRDGSQVSRARGETSEAVRRMEMAQRILRASPFDSDVYEMGTSLDLAAAYSEAGRDQDALAEFQRAGSLMATLGRDETETAVVLYNDWAVELDQVGRPLEAEKLFRRVIDISRDNSTEDAVSPMVLTNYARVQRELNHLTEAQDHAENAYNKAKKTGDELVISQSLMERSRIDIAQHNLTQADAMLAEVEPRLRKDLPPGHYAFAAIAGQRANIALGKHDLPAALQFANQALAILDASIKAGGEGGFSLPSAYMDRSAVELAMGRADLAESDADRAVTLLHAGAHPADVSSKLGHAYLALARAQAAGDKPAEARTAAAQAVAQLESSVGADHPDTLSARLLAR